MQEFRSIKLSCQADGDPTPSYSWKFNGKITGVVQNSWTLIDAHVSDAGNYTCVAKNDFGTAETTREVRVGCKLICYDSVIRLVSCTLVKEMR